jgi:hypothetical protein
MLNFRLAVVLAALGLTTGALAAETAPLRIAQTGPEVPDTAVVQPPATQVNPQVPVAQPETVQTQQVTPPPVPLPQPQVVPPPVPQPVAAQYFVTEGGQPIGPFTLEQIKARIRAGTLARGGLVWKSGTRDWVAVETFAELQQDLAALPPVVPASETFRTFLLGTWEASSVNAQGVTQTVTVSFLPDGTYSGISTSEFLGTTTNVPVSGKWSVKGMDKDRFAVTYLGEGGTPGTTTKYRMVDANSVEDTDTGTVARRINQ